MEWLYNLFFEQSALQAVVILSLITAVGLGLGKIHIFGISLGVTFVFFMGILVKKTGPLIAEEMVIPPKYIVKITTKLRTAKLIGSEPGSQGGYYLMKPLENITLMEVLSVMESTVKINRCLEPDAYCSRGGVNRCSIRGFYLALQHEFEEKWLSQRLSGIMEKTFLKKVAKTIFTEVMNYIVFSMSHGKI